MTVTNTQLKGIHAALKQCGFENSKADLVHSFSNGRTESSRDLTRKEAQELLDYLNNKIEPDECDKKRKRLIGMAYGIGANTAFVKAWCEKYGVFGLKKKFNEYNSRELSGLIAKFGLVEKHAVTKILEEVEG